MFQSIITDQSLWCQYAPSFWSGWWHYNWRMFFKISHISNSNKSVHARCVSFWTGVLISTFFCIFFNFEFPILLSLKYLTHFILISAEFPKQSRPFCDVLYSIARSQMRTHLSIRCMNSTVTWSQSSALILTSF